MRSILVRLENILNSFNLCSRNAFAITFKTFTVIQERKGIKHSHLLSRYSDSLLWQFVTNTLRAASIDTSSLLYWRKFREKSNHLSHKPYFLDEKIENVHKNTRSFEIKISMKPNKVLEKCSLIYRDMRIWEKKLRNLIAFNSSLYSNCWILLLHGWKNCQTRRDSLTPSW